MQNLEITNDEGLDFMDIREEYVEEEKPIAVLPRTRVDPKPRTETVTLGEFEQRLMQTISQLEAEELKLESEAALSSVNVITAALTTLTYSPLDSSKQSNSSATSATPLLTPSTDSSSPFPTKTSRLKTSLTASTASLTSPATNASDTPLQHSHSNNSITSLSKQKSVSFSQTLHVDSFSKYSSPSTPPSKSTESLAKSPAARTPRKPFILNDQDTSDSETDSDSQYTDESDGDFTYESTDDPRYRYNPDHAPNGASLPAVLNQVVENDTAATNNDEMHDYLTVNQMQKEYYQKREMFIRHQIVKRGAEADGYEDMQWTNAFGGDEYDGMTFKPQDVKIRYAEGEIDSDIIDYARECKEQVEEVVDSPLKEEMPITQLPKKPVSRFMAMRQSNKQVIELG